MNYVCVAASCFQKHPKLLPSLCHCATAKCHGSKDVQAPGHEEDAAHEVHEDHEGHGAHESHESHEAGCAQEVQGHAGHGCGGARGDHGWHPHEHPGLGANSIPGPAPCHKVPMWPIMDLALEGI